MSKPPVLFLPGLLCDQALWAHQTNHLSDIAEGLVADLTQDSSIPAMAERVLRAAPPHFALIGLSMGGYVAFEILRQAPQRVTKLALLDTQARPDTPEARQQRQGLIDLAQKGEFKGVTTRLLPRLIHNSRLMDDALTGVIMRMAESVGREAFARQQTAIMNRVDSRPDLPDIKCPTLVLCGREDALTPLALHQEMVQLIPGTVLSIVEDCGHLSALERPHAVTAMLRHWLSYLNS